MGEGRGGEGSKVKPVKMTAEGEEDDGSLRIAEVGAINKESDDGKAGGHEAHNGPHGHPHGGQRLVVSVKDHIGVALLCAAPRSVDVDEPVGQVVAAARIHPAHAVHLVLNGGDAVLDVDFLQSCNSWSP